MYFSLFSLAASVSSATSASVTLASTSATVSSVPSSSNAFNATLMDNLNNDFELRHLSLFLRSYCGQPLAQMLQNRTMNLTLFAPTDQAVEAGLNWTSVRGGADLNCSNVPGGNLTTLSQGCMGISANISQLPVAEIAPCLPLILSYHVVPERLNLTAGSGMNVTVVNTMLNDTRLTNLTQQVLVLNQTETGEWYANHGAWPAGHIRLNRTIEGVNGVAYLVDRILFPPLNFTESLQMLNLTLNQTQVPEVANFTAFLPIEMQGYQNISQYLVNGTVLYNNMTSPSNVTLSSLAGYPLNITIGSNYTVQVNNTPVVQSNILLANGVLHLLGSQNQTQSRGAAGGGGLVGRFIKRC